MFAAIPELAGHWIFVYI